MHGTRLTYHKSMQSTHTRLDIAILFLLHVHALVRYKIYLHFHVFVALK